MLLLLLLMLLLLLAFVLLLVVPQMPAAPLLLLLLLLAALASLGTLGAMRHTWPLQLPAPAASPEPATPQLRSCRSSRGTIRNRGIPGRHRLPRRTPAVANAHLGGAGART
jgi:hypothetical protein